MVVESDKKEAALQSLVAMGTNAVPVLIEVMGYSPAQLDQWYNRLPPQKPDNKGYGAMLKRKLPGVAGSVIAVIPEASLYVTNLFPLLQDPRSEVRQRGANFLSYLSHKVDVRQLLPALPALKDNDREVRRNIINAFRRSAETPQVRTALEEVLNDSREDLRLAAANALLRADKDHARALATLKSLFVSANPHTRYFAVRDYIQSDPVRPRTEKELLPILLRLLSSNDSWSQTAAAGSLADFGPRARETAPELQKLLLSADLEVRRAATNALRVIAPEMVPGKPAAPASREVVLQHLQDLYSTNQAMVFQNVKAMGTNAVPLLIEILGYETTQADQWYEKAYAKAPASIRSRMSKPEALEKLRSQASVLLLNMPETHLYLTDLFVLLKDPRVEVRQRAASLIPHSIRNYGQHLDDSLMLECLPSLRDSDTMVRRYMVHAFIARWAVLPRAKAALEALLTDPVEAVRLEAATVLLQPDGNNQAALQALKSLFASTNAVTRQWAAARYLNVGSPAGRLEDEMVPIFISTLSGSDKDQLKSACLCLGRFGPRAKAAVPALMKHLQSQDPELQKTASEALEKIAPEALPGGNPRP